MNGNKFDLSSKYRCPPHPPRTFQEKFVDKELLVEVLE